MTVTAYSGGQMILRGMQVWERSEATPPPPALPPPPPILYRLTVQRPGTDQEKWPRATGPSREQLLDLLTMFENLDYELVSLERLANPSSNLNGNAPPYTG